MVGVSHVMMGMYMVYLSSEPYIRHGLVYLAVRY